MALTLAELIEAVRDRLSDYETTQMYTDAEIGRFLAQAVDDYSEYRPSETTTDITPDADAIVTDFDLPADSVSVIKVTDPETGAEFTQWEERQDKLVLVAAAASAFTTLTVHYGAVHALNGAADGYDTIRARDLKIVTDLCEARVLDSLAVDMAKRPQWSDTQAKADHRDAAVFWSRRARDLRNQVAQRVTGGVIGALS